MRTWVYIDGFNLYYAIKQYGKKWIDIKRLAEEAMPDGTEVHKVKYYTARVSGAIDPDQPRRQQIYLKALQTIPEVEIFFGNFLSRPQWKPLLNLPVAERSIHSSDPPVRLPAGEHLVSEVAETGGETFELLNIGSYPGLPQSYSGPASGDLNPSQRKHSGDVVGQLPQASSN